MKTVFITGCNRGIGLGLTNRFLENQFQVIATYRQEKNSTELFKLAEENKNLSLFKLDLNSEQDFTLLKDYLKNKNKIDILINNAGMIGSGKTSFLQTSTQDVLQVFQNNTLAPMKVCQTLFPFLSSGAVITNITSQMGSITDNRSGGYYDYRISKAALNMLHKCLSIEFKDFTFLTLHPGWVQTDMGGKQAPTSIADSTAGLYKVITGKIPRTSGQFLNYLGQEIPW